MKKETPAPNQWEMDFWFPHTRQVLTVQEVALAFCMSDNQVRALIDEQKFVATPINDQTKVERQHLRLERWSVVAWKLNQLEDQEIHLPIKENAQVKWWRTELRKRA